MPSADIISSVLLIHTSRNFESIVAFVPHSFECPTQALLAEDEVGVEAVEAVAVAEEEVLLEVAVAIEEVILNVAVVPVDLLLEGFRS